MITEFKSAIVALFLILSLQMMVCIAVHGEPFVSFSNSPKDSGDKGSQSRKGSDSNGLYKMGPAEFFQQAKVEEKIDFQHINHSLLSAAIFHETNQRRKTHGKEQLSHLPRLDEAATMQAREMAEHAYVTHVNPRKQDIRTPLERVWKVGLKDYHFVAENVASHFGIQYEPGKPLLTIEKDGATEYYYQPEGKPIANHTYRSFADSLMDKWMNSPGHRQNILSDKPRFLGTGCSMSKDGKGPVKFYCVQLFVDRFGR
jgi:uncharacterized protein YkwD